MKKIKPPYIPIGWIDAFFDLVNRVKLEKIDRSTIAQYKICSLGNASKVVSALKFFHLVDDKGKVIEDNIKSLKLHGESRTVELKRIVTQSYTELLDQINISQAKKEDLINFFIGNYNFSAAQANQATRMFLHLAQKAGLELSEELKQFSKPSKKGRPVGSKNIRKSSKMSREKILGVAETVKAEIEDSATGTILVQIRGKGVSMDLAIKSKKEIRPNLEIISKLLDLNLAEE